MRFSIVSRDISVDARERLQRYLEQRRELGESELVLDRLSVDEVMSMLGVRGAPRPPRHARATAAPEGANAASVSTPRETPAPVIPAAPPAASEASPEAPRAPEPTSRLDPAATGDWRQALRQADATPPGTRHDVQHNAPPATGVESVAARAAVLPPWLAALNVAAGLAVAPDAIGSSTRAPIDGLDDLVDLPGIADLVRACTRCALHTTARNAVPGEGNPHAELLCVGEAPGANEDEQGRPFVGEAGQLLTKILAAIDFPRESVYICNVLKHRPPANRDPLPDEVAACQPFLRRQILTVKPRVIIALGRFAAQTLLGTTIPLGKLREQIHFYHGIPVIVTYHPAALLRNEAWKRPTWSDVKLARRILDASRAANAVT
jgi:uracil-DNA glycosylase